MTSLALMDTAAQKRRRFVNNALDATGRSNIRALWSPVAAEGLTMPDAAIGGAFWTHNVSPVGRLVQVGQGYGLTFNGSTQSVSTPDRNDLSFVSGTDQPFTVFALANVTDTANGRAFGAKFAGVSFEYEFRVTTTDLLSLLVLNSDGTHFASRDSSAAITMGSFRLFGGTYSAATGGATAANDMTLYENGAVKASAATNDALYTTMTSGTSPLEAGSSGGAGTRFMQGTMSLFMLCAGNLSASVHAQMLTLCRSYFGTPS